VRTIPQRELRNNVAEVLRRAEAGERLIITVGGRPVAELGPLASPRAMAPPARLAEILAETPADPAWAEDLARMRAEDEAAAVDPWAT
jgi:prevent-host-death family protein